MIMLTCKEVSIFCLGFSPVFCSFCISTGCPFIHCIRQFVAIGIADKILRTFKF